MKTYYDIYKSPIGSIVIAGNEDGITNINLKSSKGLESWEKREGFFNDVIKQLDEYFNNKRKAFDLKLNIYGTNFQKQVWNALIKIPYGKTCSYQDIANMVNNKKACRAVGSANGKNPIPIIIPCHRVISSDGKLGGYSSGLDIKRKLLKIEGINIF